MGDTTIEPTAACAASSNQKAVVYIPLPSHFWRQSLKRVLLIAATVLAAALVWAAIDPLGGEMIWVMLAIGVILIPITVIVASSVRSHRETQIGDEPVNSLTDVLASLDGRLTTPYYWDRPWWTWDEFANACHDAHIEPPRTIVDKRVKQRLERINLVPDFLEPEPILSSGTSGRRAAVLMIVLYCLCMLFHLSVGNYFFAGLFAAFGVFLAATYPPLRDLFRTMRLDDGNLIAGLGSLSHKGDKRWTTNDAVVLVQTTNGKPPYYVSFVGEAGYKLITFTDENDPDFVKLWQRWNHPKPRPELVVE